MFRLYAILLFLSPLACFAQYSVSGSVFNADDKKPVADASVFLNNAIAGGKTNDKGTFILTNVRPGQYDLVVSVVGFETHHQVIMVSGDLKLPVIEIQPKTIMLAEVKIRPNNNWAKDYETFKKLFFGTSEFAADCKILNPGLLSFDFDASTRVFTASATDFLEIENKALGYKIKYLLNDFTNDAKTGMLYYEGSAAFEELKGTTRQQRRRKKNRLQAYQGSAMHFLRAVISNTIDADGFRALRLIRKPNPDYKGGLDKKYKDALITTPLTTADFAQLTDEKDLFALSFSDCLYVLYDKKKALARDKKPDNAEPPTPEFLNDPVATTVIFDSPYAVFDRNGIIINPRSLIFEGAWGTSLMAQLLPVDYVEGE